MTKSAIEYQLLKYTQNYHLTNEDKPLLLALKKYNPKDEVDISNCSEDFFNFLLYESDLEEDFKAQLAHKFFESVKNKDVKIVDENTSINSIDKLMLFYKQNLEKLEYNFDYNLYGKIIPIYVKFELIQAKQGTPRHVLILLKINLCNLHIMKINHLLFHKDILEIKRNSKQINFYTLLSPFNILKQKGDIAHFKSKVKEANILKNRNGFQLKTDKVGIVINEERRTYGAISFKIADLSKNGETSRVIIESLLETEVDINKFQQETRKEYALPYVRVFSLLNKRYFFVHIDDLEKFEYDRNAISKLIINKKSKAILNKVFQSNASDYYSDFIKDKHGGLVILAEGPPGVGKTSTAEVYAELQEKPLYIVQIKELGTTAEAIEKNLMIIFERVQKWKAVLLFDEIDIFLYKRQQDLEQSAIVGVFLRLLDYFSGLIFFTTNRSEVLDPAILSRISIKIKYDSLDERAQNQIWKSKLLDAGLTIDGLNILSKMKLNGREIKNAIRISKIIFGNSLKEIEVKELLEDFM